MYHSSTARKSSCVLAAPAVRVIVLVHLALVIDVAPAEFFEHVVGDLAGEPAGEEPVAWHVNARLVNRRQHGQVQLLREVEILLAAPRRDVHDAGSLSGGDLLPRDHAMRGLDLGRPGQVVERPFVLQAEQAAAGELFEDLERPVLLHHAHEFAREIIYLAALADLHVRHLRVHRAGHVGGERPRRGRPHQQVLARPPAQAQLDVHRPGRESACSPRGAPARKCPCRSAGTRASRRAPCRSACARGTSSGTPRSCNCSRRTS